jgi:hypothetical protein
VTPILAALASSQKHRAATAWFAPHTKFSHLPLHHHAATATADYAAAYTIDRKWMGRKRLQAFGFLMM